MPVPNPSFLSPHINLSKKLDDPLHSIASLLKLTIIGNLRQLSKLDNVLNVILKDFYSH